MIPNDIQATGFVSNQYDISEPGKQGWTWTWNLILGTLLSEAEDRYGKRSLEHAILGIHFGGDNPETWCPTVGNTKCVAIRLSTGAACKPRIAFSELAHEVVHLLCPGNRDANNLEEGIAVIFSEEMCSKYGYPPAKRGKYAQAAEAVEHLLTLRPDAIRLIRADHQDMRAATPEYLRATFGVDQSASAFLAETFYQET